MMAQAAADDLHVLATFDAGVDHEQIIVDLAGLRPDPHLWSSQDETDQGFS